MKTIQKIVNAGFKVEIDNEFFIIVYDHAELIETPLTTAYLESRITDSVNYKLSKELYSDEAEKQALLNLIDALEERKETNHKQELKAFYNGTGK